MRRKEARVPGAWAVPLLVLSCCFSSAWAREQQAFRPAETAAVFRRQDNCIANFYSCSSQGSQFNGVCCQFGQNCQLDQNNQPACCPANAVCTGTAPGTFVTPTAAPPVSYVPNAYFSFPYITTVFANTAACSAAASQCASNYGACTAQLQGGGNYVVTIIVPGGGGTTVAPSPGASLAAASAAGVCSSLSTVACFSLQPSVCATAGTTTAGFVIGTAASAAPPPGRPPLGALLGAALVASLAAMTL